jgi:chromosome segregation ATPase
MYETLRGEKEEIEREIADLRHKSIGAEQQQPKLESLEMSLGDLEAQKESLVRDIESIRYDLQQANHQNKELEDLYKGECAKVEEAASKLSASEKMVSKLKAKLKQVLKDHKTEKSESAAVADAHADQEDNSVVVELKAEKESLEARLSQREHDLTSLSDQLDQLKLSLKETEKHLEALKDENESLKANFENFSAQNSAQLQSN